MNDVGGFGKDEKGVEGTKQELYWKCVEKEDTTKRYTAVGLGRWKSLSLLEQRL